MRRPGAAEEPRGRVRAKSLRGGPRGCVSRTSPDPDMQVARRVVLLPRLSEAALLARIFNDLEFRLAAIEFIAFACCPGLVGMAVSGL